jgi:hypothetical protein
LEALGVVLDAVQDEPVVPDVGPGVVTAEGFENNERAA